MAGSDQSNQRTAEERARAAAERAARRAARQGKPVSEIPDDDPFARGVDVPPPDAFGLPPADGLRLPAVEPREGDRAMAPPVPREELGSSGPDEPVTRAPAAEAPAARSLPQPTYEDDVTRVHEPVTDAGAAAPARPATGVPSQSAGAGTAVPHSPADMTSPDVVAPAGGAEVPASSELVAGAVPPTAEDTFEDAPTPESAQPSVGALPAAQAQASAGASTSEPAQPAAHAGTPESTQSFAGAQPPGSTGAFGSGPVAPGPGHEAAGDVEATQVHAIRHDVPTATARPVSAVPAGKSRNRRGGGRREAVSDPYAERRRPRWGRRLLALIALIGIGAALYLINATFQPFHDGGRGAVRVEIPEGADVGRIGDILERRGVVASGTFFNVNVTLTGRRGRLRPGEYTLQRDMSYGDASEALMQGPRIRVVETFDLTIPEGRSRREIADIVAESAVRGDYLDATTQPRFRRRARELGLPGDTRTLEGFLFPATYELAGEATSRDLVGKQLDAFEENFAQVDMGLAQRRNLTRYDVLTIASMVEREAAIQRERPLIAAVIHNRLRQEMPLGIDATIRYATDNWTRPIRVSELEADGPYNTRLRQGLPPTPIGNPGLASIEAAANPANVDHLYYVVKPGTCGEHAFSSSAEQFERDSQRYNAARDAQGGQSPTSC